MAYLFLQDTDFDTLIRSEIKNLLDSSTTNYKLETAERIAIDQIKNHIAGRYDCNAIFTPVTTVDEVTTDSRDRWIITITIDIALYHLYAQSNKKDIPEHRGDRYQDAIDWLKSAGKGTIKTNLPMLEDDQGDIRIFSRYTPDNHRY
jgi:phage gp36-like protein